MQSQGKATGQIGVHLAVAGQVGAGATRVLPSSDLREVRGRGFLPGKEAFVSLQVDMSAPRTTREPSPALSVVR